MVELLPSVIDMVRRPETSKIMATVDPDGTPHAIVCGSLMVPDPLTIAVGKVWMKRTEDNLLNGSKAEFLVWYGKTAYSIPCTARERIDAGPILDRFKEVLSAKNMVPDAVWVFDVQSVFDESATSRAGTQIE